jgi:hypothetical protein
MVILSVVFIILSAVIIYAEIAYIFGYENNVIKNLVTDIGWGTASSYIM